MTDSNSRTPPAPRPVPLRRRPGRFAAHSLLSSGTSTALYGLGALTGPLLARSLGAAGRGQLAGGLMTVSLLSILGTFGFAHATGYLHARHDQRALYGNAFLTTAVASLPLLLAGWFVVPRVLHAGGVALVLARVLLLTIPLGGITSAYLEVLRASGDARRWNLVRAVPLVVNALAIVGLAALRRLDLASALGAQLAGSVVFHAWCAAGLRRQLPFRLDRAAWSVQRAYATRAFVGTAADTVTTRLDQVLLAFTTSTASLGNYAVAVTLASVSGPVTSGFAATLYSHLLDARSTERSTRAMRATVAISVAVSTAIAVAGYALIPVIFGREFQSARVALLLLLPGQVATDAVQVRFTELHAAGRPGQVSRATLVSGVLTLVGLAVLVPPLGIYGAALVSTASYVARYAVAARAVRRLGPPNG